MGWVGLVEWKEGWTSHRSIDRSVEHVGHGSHETTPPPWKTCANDPDLVPDRHPTIETKKIEGLADRVVVEEEDDAHVHRRDPRYHPVVADRSDHQGSFPHRMHRRTWPVMQVDGQDHHTKGTCKPTTKRATKIRPIDADPLHRNQKKNTHNPRGTRKKKQRTSRRANASVETTSVVGSERRGRQAEGTKVGSKRGLVRKRDDALRSSQCTPSFLARVADATMCTNGRTNVRSGRCPVRG